MYIYIYIYIYIYPRPRITESTDEVSVSGGAPPSLPPRSTAPRTTATCLRWGEVSIRYR